MSADTEIDMDVALDTHSVLSFDEGRAVDGQAVEMPGAKLVARFTGDGMDFVWLEFRVERSFWRRAPSAVELMQARRALLRPIYEMRRAEARTNPRAAHTFTHGNVDSDPWLPPEFRADIPVVSEDDCPWCLEGRYAWIRNVRRDDMLALSSVARHLPDGPLRRTLDAARAKAGDQP